MYYGLSPISPAHIAEFAKTAKQNLRNFTILAKILPITANLRISSNFLEIRTTNYFVGVMNDFIFDFEFPKFTLLNFYYIAFGGELDSKFFGDSIHSNLLLNF